MITAATTNKEIRSWSHDTLYIEIVSVLGEPNPSLQRLSFDDLSDYAIGVRDGIRWDERESANKEVGEDLLVACQFTLEIIKAEILVSSTWEDPEAHFRECISMLQDAISKAKEAE